MDYRQSLRYLESFINYEKKSFYDYKTCFSLERVRDLCGALSIPFLSLPVIHIAGTKGKGSVASFCAWMLAASGFKTGLYTSPHFFDFRERIRTLSRSGTKIRNNLIPKRDVFLITEEIKEAVSLLAKKGIGGFTFFEIYTVLALRYFFLEKHDFIVLETGLGGRLDATNVVLPLVSVITHIGYDHTDKLGHSLSAIAGEKAGIIKKNCPLVCASQEKEAEAVIRKKAEESGAPAYFFGCDFWPEQVNITGSYTGFDFIFNDCKVKNARIRLAGRHQVENACLGLAVTKILKDRGRLKSRPALKKGLFSCRIEGRAEIISRDPLVMIDIAHNPSSFSALAETVRTYYPDKKIILVLAASKDKDVKNMVNKLKYNRIILAAFANPRSFSPQELAEKLDIKGGLSARTVPEALKKAEAVYDEDSLILVAGSFFLAAEAKRAIARWKIEQ